MRIHSKGIAAFLIDNGLCTPEIVSQGLNRVTLNPYLAKATAKADLVSESVIERLDLKRKIHQTQKKGILT